MNRCRLMLLLLGLSLSGLQAQSIRTYKDTEAFDPKNPNILLGSFLAGSKLEVQGKLDHLGMVAVLYFPKEGAPVPALCRASDLVLSVPGSMKTSTTATSSDKTSEHPKLKGPPSSKGYTEEGAAAQTAKIDAALSKATSSKKLLLLRILRSGDSVSETFLAACKSGKLHISEKDFVIVDIEADNPDGIWAAVRKGKLPIKGVPYLIVMDSQGKSLCSSFGDEKSFPRIIEMIDTAKKVVGRPVSP